MLLRILLSASLFIVSGVAIPAVAQKVTAADTTRLQQELTHASVNSEKLKILPKLVDAYWESDRDKVRYYLEEMERIGATEERAWAIGYVRNKQAHLLYYQSALDSAQQLYQQAYTLYQEEDSLSLAWLAQTRIGLMSCLQGDYEAAEEVYRKVARKLPQQGFLKVKGDLCNQFATLYHYQGIVDSADHYYQQSIAYYEELKDTIGLLAPVGNYAILLINSKPDSAYKKLQFIANYQRSKEKWTELLPTLTSLANLEVKLHNDFLKSYAYATEGYELARRLEDTNHQASFLYALAAISRGNEDNEQALNYLEKGIALASEHQLIDIHIGLLIEQAGLYEDQGHPEQAKRYLEQALNLSRQTGGNRQDGITLESMGRILIELGQLDSAYTYSLDASRLGQETGEREVIWRAYCNLGRICLLRGRYEEAKKWGQQAYELANMQNIPEGRLLTTELLAETEQALENYQAAFNYLSEARVLGDSLLNVDQVRSLTREQKDYEFQLEKELIAAQQAREQAILRAESQRNLVFAGGVGLLALVLGGFFYQSRRQNRQITQQKQQLDQLNQTKDRIFAIIGHDLQKPAIAFRGITQKINYLLAKEDYERLAALGQNMELEATSLGQLTDNLLNWALLQKDVLAYQPEAVPLEAIAEEVSATFKSRLADKELELKLDIPDGAKVYADRSSLRTIVRNLVDNAIKYTPKAGRITLSARVEGSQMIVQVEDTGIGIPEEKLHDLFLLYKDKSQVGTNGEKGTGLGLHLVQELAKLNQSIVQVNSRLQQGTTFQLSFPIV